MTKVTDLPLLADLDEREMKKIAGGVNGSNVDRDVILVSPNGQRVRTTGGEDIDTVQVNGAN